MAADGITKTVTQKRTVDLVNYLSNDDKFIRSGNEPQAGDIFLWRSKSHGHTGIVEKVDADVTVHTIEAYGRVDGTKRELRGIADFTGHKRWKGFYRPKVETPNGNLEGKESGKKTDEKMSIKMLKKQIKR